MTTLVVGVGDLPAAIQTVLEEHGFVVVRISAKDPLPQGIGAASSAVLCVEAAGMRPFESLSDDAWGASVDDVLAATFATAQAVTSVVGDGGAVVIVGSAAALGASASVDDAALHAALVGLTRALALDQASRGVRVNLVLRPTGDGRGLLAARATATDLARAVAFLCSEGSAVITGQCLSVDGGQGLNKQPF